MFRRGMFLRVLCGRGKRCGGRSFFRQSFGVRGTDRSVLPEGVVRGTYGGVRVKRGISATLRGGRGSFPGQQHPCHISQFLPFQRVIQKIFASHPPQAFPLFRVKGKPEYRNEGKGMFSLEQTYLGHGPDNVVFRHMSVERKQGGRAFFVQGHGFRAVAGFPCFVVVAAQLPGEHLTVERAIRSQNDQGRTGVRSSFFR